MGDRTYKAVADASGNATATIQPLNGTHSWRVSQVTTEMPGASGLADVRKNGVLVTSIRATKGVASGPPEVELKYDDLMTVEWTGLTPGSTGKVYIIYEVV